MPSETTPRLLLGRALIEAGRWRDAEPVLQDAEAEYVPAHDGLRNMNARMQDQIYRRYGREVGDHIGDAVYDQMTEWSLIGSKPTSFREQVEAIAMLWHWHRTPFRMTEDADKVTFSLEPCGSGGRMINEGAYTSGNGRPLAILAESSPASFSQSNFPSWCTHCAFSNRAFLRRGLCYFLIEGWTPERRDGACAAHAYKRLSSVPEATAARVGQQIAQCDQPIVADQVFTETELTELARPAVERIIEAVRRQDAQTALDLIDRSWRAWLSLHHAYRCWYALFYQACLAEFGEPAADELLIESAWELVAPMLEHQPKSLPSWMKFWRSHGAPLGINESASHTELLIDLASIVHPQLAEQDRIGFAQRLAEAITAGATRHGYRDQFGTLALRGPTLAHRLPPGLL